MIMFFNKADNSITAATLDTVITTPPAVRQAYLVESDNAIQFSFSTGYMNLDNGVKSSSTSSKPMIYYYNHNLTTS